MPSLDVQPPITPAATSLGEQFTRDVEAFSNAFVADLGRTGDKIGGLFDLDPSAVRLEAAGLPPGGDPDNAVPTTDVAPMVSRNSDPRVRLSLPPGNTLFYRGSNPGNILGPLADTNGIIFPYLPTINMSYMANYGELQPTHTNQSFPMYQNSQVTDIVVAGDFTCQTDREARYLLACLHFLKVATKMFYGQDQLKGTPPVVLRLSGHGQYMFDNIPVVVTSALWTLPIDVDYIPVAVNSNVQPTAGELGDYSGVTNIPTELQISVSLKPMYSRTRYVNDFSLTEYARGRLLSRGNKGGFI